MGRRQERLGRGVGPAPIGRDVVVGAGTTQEKNVVHADFVESARQAALASLVSDTVHDAGWIPQSLEWLEQSLNALALPYHDHPDFDQEWLRT